MTRRFDRTRDGDRLHMQSLGAMAHLDFNQAGAHGYEQALDVIRRLGLSMDDVEEQFRRMVFNVVARNQDDHVKNIAYLMDRRGRWSLSPAFDVTYAYNPSGDWTSSHQMTINGKRDDFTPEDFRAVARLVSMKRGRAEAIHEEVRSAVGRWMEFAERAGVGQERAERVGRTHRLELADESPPAEGSRLRQSMGLLVGALLWAVAVVVAHSFPVVFLDRELTGPTFAIVALLFAPLAVGAAAIGLKVARWSLRDAGFTLEGARADVLIGAGVALAWATLQFAIQTGLCPNTDGFATRSSPLAQAA